MSKTEKERWALTIGVHRGTIASRCLEEPKKMDSLEACRTEVAKAENQYSALGYMIWFATAIGDGGEEVSLHDGVPPVDEKKTGAS
jgi:hypothetical protein